MRNLIIIVLSFILVSCHTVKSSMTTITDVKKDSVSNEVFDSSYLVPVAVDADSAWINAFLECDENGKVLMRQLEIVRGQRVNPTFEIKDNIIRIRIPVDSAKVYAIYNKRFEKGFKSQKKEEIKVRTVEKVVYKTPFRSLIFAFILGFILAIILFIINKFKKILPL